jgi:hypothetical protein
MDYRTIKAEARALGCKVNDLIALAPQNDPFYTGSPSDVAKAEWFARLWERFGGKGGHIRLVHYRADAPDPPIIKPDGEPYENTERCWNYLCNAAKYARYLGLVPALDFVDQRNFEPILHARYYEPEDWQYEDPAPGWEVEDRVNWGDYDLPGLPAIPDLPANLPDLPGYAIQGYRGIQQAYHVELWAEKTGVDNVLLPLCEQYHLNLVRGKGELSVTMVLEFLERVRKADRPGRILYISDYDPAGLGMPISIGRKIEFYQRKHGYDDLDIALDPIILTTEQVKKYDLPRKPVKDSDLRKASFEAAHGKGQVELDALEALHPGQMAKIVRSAILQYHDPDLEDAAWDQRRSLSRALGDARGDILQGYATEVDTLRGEYARLRTDFAETQGRFSELVAQFQAEIDAHHERLEGIQETGRDLYGKLLGDLGEVDVDVDDYSLPDPDLPPESGDLLYDSTRGYLEQLDFYKAQRNGRNH